jgi:hypothetical protein
MSGWVLDPDSVDPIEVHVYAAGLGSIHKADQPRGDIASAFPAYGTNHGFSATVKVPSGTSQVCAYGINASGAHLSLGCRTVTVSEPRPPVGNFEQLNAVAGGARIAGWALDPDVKPGITIDVYVDGVLSKYTASRTRSDVGSAFPANGSEHGFEETLQMPVGTHNVCIWAIDGNGGVNISLGCKSVTVS